MRKKGNVKCDSKAEKGENDSMNQTEGHSNHIG